MPTGTPAYFLWKLACLFGLGGIMDKRKKEVIDPEDFDADVPADEQVILPGKPVTSPPVPGEDDDADDELEDENEAVQSTNIED
jgi:hypothetical protein